MSLPIRKEVQRTKGYSLAKHDYQIKLNQNESPWDLPEPLKQKALARFQELSWNRYPSPYCDSLRKLIAGREGWNPEGVIVTGGSNILIQAIVLASAIRGKVMTVTPSFSLYGLEGALLENQVIEVPLNPGDFSFPRDLFLKRLKKERPNVVFLANPNAPTGNLFAEEDLAAILKVAKGLVVIDEAYYPFSGMTLRPYLKKYPNLLILRTFSKVFSMGGIRLGYLLGRPTIVSQILKVVLPFTIGVLTQAVAEVVLNDAGYVDSLVRKILQERDLLYTKLKGIPEIKVYPSQANFLLFQTPRSKSLFNGLIAKGILIRDVSSKRLPNALRVSVGTPEENRRFLEGIKSLFL